MSDSSPDLLRLTDGEVCCSQTWEAAYLRFETPEEERRKFLRRLRILGAPHWPRDAEVVELFCGRGNGLRAERFVPELLRTQWGKLLFVGRVAPALPTTKS